jgi:predicted methyltransferase
MTSVKIPLAALALGTCLMLWHPAATQPQETATLSAGQIAAIVAAPDRSAADRVNDQRRMPEHMLAFIGIRPGVTALDLSAAGGYTTELLARAIGPTGRVYGQSRPVGAPAAPPAAPFADSPGRARGPSTRRRH